MRIFPSFWINTVRLDNWVRDVLEHRYKLPFKDGISPQQYQKNNKSALDNIPFVRNTVSKYQYQRVVLEVDSKDYWRDWDEWDPPLVSLSLPIGECPFVRSGCGCRDCILQVELLVLIDNVEGTHIPREDAQKLVAIRTT